MIRLDAGGVHEPVAIIDGEMDEPLLLRTAGGETAVYSHRSPSKETANEDAAAIIPLNEDVAVLAVADGCGGHAAGEQAARVAIESLHRSVIAVENPSAGIRDAILDAFEHANREIAALGLGAATTLAVAEVRGREVRAYHTGDSDILVTGQRGRVKLQTLAHAPVAYAVEAGVLDESAALRHEDRSLISNIVGSQDMRVDLASAVTLSVRDTVLVTSDGLTDNLGTGEIVDLIRVGSLADAAQRLADRCRAQMTSTDPGEPSKPDDLTFVLYRPSSG